MDIHPEETGNCIDCPDFSKKEHLCDADILRKKYPIECLLKMLLMQLWISNLENPDGEEWKYGV